MHLQCAAYGLHTLRNSAYWRRPNAAEFAEHYSGTFDSGMISIALIEG
jgi:hypothetical protein